jgi:hypothetical protein
VHSVTAVYSGDAASASSTSAALTQVVRIATSLTLATNKNPVRHNDTVIFTASVASEGATGSVQFFDGSALLGAITLSNGSASFSWVRPAAGTHAIQAVYGGDATHSGSSATLTETVKP